jgi:hypothetical protein
MVFWKRPENGCRVVAVSRRTSAPHALTDASGNLQCSGRPSPCRSTASPDAVVGKVLLSKQDLWHAWDKSSGFACDYYALMSYIHRRQEELCLIITKKTTTSPAKLEARIYATIAKIMPGTKDELPRIISWFWVSDWTLCCELVIII